MISVIIPVYNAEKYIRRCIESVLRQTYVDIEIVIVDDGSTDDSVTVCKEIAKNNENIRIISQENAGALEARKKGLSYAQGDTIAFVDSDDWIECQMYEKMIEQMRQYEVDLVCSGYYIDRGMTMSLVEDRWSEGMYLMNARDLYEKGLIIDEETGEKNITSSLCNKLFERNALERIVQKFTGKSNYAEDTALIYSLLPQIGSLYIMKEAFYHYCINEGSITHTHNRCLLEQINKAYLFLDESYKGHEFECYLMREKDKIIADCLVKGLNAVFFRQTNLMIPTYMLPDYEITKEMRIGIYGYGRVGKCYINQLKTQEYQKLFLFDMYEWQRNENVFHPSKIKDKKLDILIIGVRDFDNAEKIRKELVDIYKIENEIIKWKPPIPFLKACMVENREAV